MEPPLAVRKLGYLRHGGVAFMGVTEPGEYHFSLVPSVLTQLGAQREAG